MIRVVGVLVVLAAGVALAAEGPAEKTAKVDEAAIRAKALTAAYLEAKVAKIEADEGRLTVTYIHEIKTPKPDGQKKLAAVQARFNVIANKQSTSLEEFNKAKAELEQAQKDAFNVEEVPIAIVFKGDPKLPVRTSLVPAGPDGKPKKLTAAEQKKLKGDPRLPGNQASWKDITVGEVVRVYYDKTKIKPSAKSDETTTYPMTMILIAPPLPNEVEMKE